MRWEFIERKKSNFITCFFLGWWHVCLHISCTEMWYSTSFLNFLRHAINIVLTLVTFKHLGTGVERYKSSRKALTITSRQQPVSREWQARYSIFPCWNHLQRQMWLPKVELEDPHYLTDDSKSLFYCQNCYFK